MEKFSESSCSLDLTLHSCWSFSFLTVASNHSVNFCWRLSALITARRDCFGLHGLWCCLKLICGLCSQRAVLIPEIHHLQSVIFVDQVLTILLSLRIWGCSMSFLSRLTFWHLDNGFNRRGKKRFTETKSHIHCLQTTIKHLLSIYPVPCWQVLAVMFFHSSLFQVLTELDWCSFSKPLHQSIYPSFPFVCLGLFLPLVIPVVIKFSNLPALVMWSYEFRLYLLEICYCLSIFFCLFQNLFVLVSSPSSFSIPFF